MLPVDQLRRRLAGGFRTLTSKGALSAAGLVIATGGVLGLAAMMRDSAPRVVGTLEAAGVTRDGDSTPAARRIPRAPDFAAQPAPAPKADTVSVSFSDMRALAAPIVAAAPPPATFAAPPAPQAAAIATPPVAPTPPPAVAAPSRPASSAFDATPPAAAAPPAVQAAIATPPAAPAPAPPTSSRLQAGAGCGAAAVSVTPREAGIMGLRIDSACRAGEFMQIRYGGVDFLRRIGDTGVLYVDLDLFAGTGQPVELVFHDATRRAVPADAKDMDRVSKVAVFWRSPVNLDLHAFEYSANLGESGHRSSRFAGDAATTLARVKESSRSQGFISTVADGTSAGVHMEVYTFVHGEQEQAGAIGLSLDFETRGDVPAGEVCGTGQLASIVYDFRLLSRDGQTASGRGAIRPAACGVPLAQPARFQQTSLPTLRLRRN